MRNGPSWWLCVIAASLLFACEGSKLTLGGSLPPGDGASADSVPAPGSTVSGSGGVTSAPTEPQAPDTDPEQDPPCPSGSCDDPPPPFDACPDDPDLTEIPPPTVRLNFPTAEASTNGQAISARGTASAGCGTVITSVSAFVDDTEYALTITPAAEVEWSFSTNLALNQANVIEIRATHSGALEASTEFVLIQEPPPSPDIDTATGIVVQPSTQTAFVVDRGLDRIVAVDLVSGARSVLSGPGVGDGPEFGQPDGGIDLDEARNQLVVTDRTLDAIVGVDLATGDRRFISDNTIADVEIVSPRGLVVDGPNAIAYYADSSLDGIVRVDLLTGGRSVVSDDTVPADPQTFDFSTPLDIAIDAGRGRLLVVDAGYDAPIEVNLADGSRRLFEQTTSNVPLSLPRGIVIDGNRALLATLAGAEIVSIDLNTGDRTVVSDADVGTGPRLGRPYDLALFGAAGDVLVADGDYAFPLTVEAGLAGAGTRIPLTDAAMPAVGEGPSFTNPTGLVIDPATSLLYLTDADTGRLLSFNVRTNRRDTILDTAPIEPEGLGFDAFSGNFFIPNDAQRDLLSVSLAGEVAVVSDADSPLLGSSTGFGFPRGRVAVEPGGASVLVTDRGRNAVHRVELATGAREYLANEFVLRGARSVVVDETANRAIVATGSDIDDSLADAVVAYDLSTGAQTSLGSSSPGALMAGSGVELEFPFSLALDRANEAVLVFDAELDAILSIDLTTLQRSVLVDASTGNGDHLSRASNDSNAMVLNAEARLLYAVNGGVGEIILVDLETGDQVVISR